MARQAAAAISEGELTKGQVRKLNALRKSVGDKIGTRAFADWLSSQRSRESGFAMPTRPEVGAR